MIGITFCKTTERYPTLSLLWILTNLWTVGWWNFYEIWTKIYVCTSMVIVLIFVRPNPTCFIFYTINLVLLWCHLISSDLWHNIKAQFEFIPKRVVFIVYAWVTYHCSKHLWFCNLISFIIIIVYLINQFCCSCSTLKK